MSTLATNAITDAAGGNTASINSFTPTESNMAGRNRIINGGMVFDQRNAGAAVTDAQNFITDRFLVSVVGSAVGRMTGQQSTTAPSGFTNSLAMTVTTTMASPGSNDGNYLQQAIEGYNIADLAWGTASAKSITLSFWVRSSVTGSFALTFFNADVSRVYGALYSVTAADTWEYKTITVPGDTSGTWGTTSGAGVRVTWGFAGGATRTASTGWNAGGGVFLTNVTGATNLMATSGATFYITGVQLEAGSVATPFERRQYGQELALCQRYYTKLSSFVANGQILSGFSTTATGSWCQVFTPVAFRASPTIGFSSLVLSDQVNYGFTITAIAGSAQTINGGGVAFTNNTGATAFRPCAINTSSSSGYLDFSAEL